jgi:hypothetical protein
VDDGNVRALPGVPQPGNVAAWSADGTSLLIVEQIEERAVCSVATWSPGLGACS